MDDKVEEAAAQTSEDQRELESVFDAREESEAMVVRGLLESAGIEALMTGLEAPQDVLPGVGGITLRVRADQAGEARRLIEEYRTADQAVDLEDISEAAPDEEPAG